MDKGRMAHRIAIFGASIVFAAGAAAHHGPHAEPLYDTSEPLELEGEVTDVFWRNPHARFRIRVTAGPQTGEIWEIETNPPGPLRRTGFTPDLLPIGSQVKVAGVVSRRRPNFMGLYNLLLPNGYEFADMARPKPLRFADERLPLNFQAGGESADSAVQEAEGIFRVWVHNRAVHAGRGRPDHDIRVDLYRSGLSHRIAGPHRELLLAARAGDRALRLHRVGGGRAVSVLLHIHQE